MSKINIKVVDMDAPMIDTAKKVFTKILNILLQSIIEAFENYREERFIANKIKEDLDKIYGIQGRSYE